MQQAIVAAAQTFYRMEEDIYLFKQTDGTVVGYLFEQGECSTVLTQLPDNELVVAEAFIAAEIKKNRGSLFLTQAGVQFKYYTARQGSDSYLIAQALS